MRHVHFIGIGGVGMSGLAQALLARGVRVSGSDSHPGAMTERLETLGAQVFPEQVAANIQAAQPEVVVYTAAVHDNNPELTMARSAGIPVIVRAAFLGRMMDEFAGPRIAVSGTHGKTTTTAMTAEVLVAGGLDPTVLIGGDYAPFGGNVRLGGGAAVISEACEAYDSFLSLRPDVSVITNVEADHLDHYRTEDRVIDAFMGFVNQTSADGALIWCEDDPGVQRLRVRLGDGGPRRRIAYGMSPHGDNCLWASDVRRDGSMVRCSVLRRAGTCEAILGDVALRVPGAHNVLNAMAAASVGVALDIPFDRIRDGIGRFQGAGRRFELLADVSGITVIDDYAHHPTEIAATIAASREAYPGRRLVMVFQPHLYSRTRDFMSGFAESLAHADAIILTDIYAAREEPIAGVGIPEMVRRIAEIAPKKTVLYAPSKPEATAAARWVSHPGDVVMTVGAGDVREIAEQFIAECQEGD